MSFLLILFCFILIVAIGFFFIYKVIEDFNHDFMVFLKKIDDDLLVLNMRVDSLMNNLDVEFSDNLNLQGGDVFYEDKSCNQ